MPISGGIAVTTANATTTTNTIESDAVSGGETAASDSVSDGITIDSALETSGADGETIDVIVRLSEADVGDAASPERANAALKRHAEESQGEVVAYAETTDGVTVRNQFWLTNAVLLEVDTSQVDLESFERFDAVSMLHANFEVELDGATGATTATGSTSTMSGSTTDAVTTGSRTTYGLEQINAPAVWDAYGTNGAGVKVAVLDTGIDVGHPDLDLYTEDPSDPTYPGGWAEFDGSGSQVAGSEPRDFGDHGTHVSGTIAGGSDGGTHIGVAPDVDLLHGAVLTNCDNGCSGTYSQILDGMQWAVDEDADVVSMSLGTSGYAEWFIDPVRNAKAAGTVVVSSAGNSGEGSSGSPGNVYDTFAIGASDENEGIASFSSGEEIVTADAWDNPPSDWPKTYIVPNVAAPGRYVRSAAPGGEYATKSGTSMAAPHVSGAMALLLSLNGELEPDALLTTLEATARKPDGSDGQDVRYGHGIIDVKAAADEVALATVEGTVTDTADDPIENATVDVDGEWNATTDENGTYAMRVDPGNRSIRIDRTGYHAETTTLDLERGETTTRDATLGFVDLVADQDALAEANGSTTVTFDVIDLEEVTVSVTDESSIVASDVSFAIDGHGESVAPNETVTFADPVTDDGFSVTTHLADDPDLNGSLELEYAFARNGTQESQTPRTGPTTVVPEIYDVGVIANGTDATGDRLRTSLEAELPVAYRLTAVEPSEAVAAAESGEYDSFVVLELPADHDLLTNPVADFVAETTANDVGVLYLGSGLDDVDPLTRLETDTDEIDRVATTDGDGTTELVVETGHPILEGVGTERDAVALVENATTRAWVDATGTRTLASATDDGVLADGTGLALDRADGQVLLGVTPRDGTLTPEGQRAVRNAVEYLGAGRLYVSDDFETYGVSGGGAETVAFGVPTTGNATVDFADGTTVDPANVTLEVDGQQIQPGDEIVIDAETVAQGLAVDVTVDGGVDGEDVQLALSVDGERVTTGSIRFETDPPARYAGAVAVNDDPVRDGLTVYAMADGTVVAETTTRDGWFGVPEADGGAGVLEVRNDSLPAAADGTVSFVLEDAETNATVAWQAGDEPRTDLAVSYDDPFATATIAAPNWTAAEREIDVSVGFDGDAARYLTDRTWLGVPTAADGSDSAPPWNATYAPTAAEEGHLAVGTRLTDLAGESYTVSDRVLVVNGELATVNGTISMASNVSSDSDRLFGTSDGGVDGSVFVTPDHGNWTDERPVENGSFEAATEVNASTHGVFVAGSGDYPVYQTVLERVVEDGETIDVDLEAGHEFAVDVRDENGDPVENASVAVTPIDASATDDAVVTLESVTDETGAWTGPNGDGMGATVTGPVTITVTPPDSDEFVDETVTRTLTVDDATVASVVLAAPSDEPSGGGGGGGYGQLRDDSPAEMNLRSTTLSDGRAMFVLTDAIRGETAATSFGGVHADGVSFTRLEVTAARDGDRDVFTLWPGRRGAAATEPAGAITTASFSHDGADRTVESLTLSFAVDDEALPDGVSREDVVVSQYHEGEWETVETTFDGTSHRATVTDLSPIAIGVEETEPVFEVVDSSIEPAEITAGESVTIEATIKNAGTGAGSTTVTVAADGDVLATERVALEPGERTTISLETPIDDSATITVDGEPIGTVTVAARSGPGDGVPGFGIGSALVAVVLLLVARTRTRSA